MTVDRLSAGRVIAGTARGVRLVAPGPMTRPLSDRVKQTLFAILEPRLRGTEVLDLFAGSGAGGIEALSRGAAGATFVEHNGAAVASIRENLGRTNLGGPRARIVQRDVLGWLGSPEFGELDSVGVVLIDPPYDQPAVLEATLTLLGAPVTRLDDGAIVVAKHFWRDQPADRIGLLASDRARRFGDTALTFYRVSRTTEAPP